VSTGAASRVSYDTVTLNGSLDFLGSAAAVNVSFEYGTTASYGINTTDQTLTSTGAFYAFISDLNPGTTYHFRARADGGTNGTTTGLDMTFTTLAVTPPGVRTTAASGVGYDRVTLNGSLDLLGTASPVNVFFEYGTTGYGSTTAVQAMTSTGTFSLNIAGLTPGTAYHFRAKANGGIHGAANGADMTFNTFPVTAPGVSTQAASGVSYDAAKLKGSLDSPGTAGTLSVTFEYVTDANYRANHSTYTNTTIIQAMTAGGAFSYNVAGLTPGTAYHFRAKADGGIHGSATGDDMTFTTLTATAPGVSTLAASGVGYDRVKLNGNLDSLGTAGTDRVSFEYAADAYYTANHNTYNKTTVIQVMTVNGAYSCDVAGLIPVTLYHFRAKTDGGIHGYATGDDMTFTTLPATAPGVSTLDAAGVSNDRVTLNGNLDFLGTATSLEVSFEYGATTSYGSNTTPQVMTEAGPFSADIFNLNPGTTIHFRAKADAGINGVISGADMIVTTLTPPTAITSAAMSITNNSVTLKGILSSLGTASAVNVFFEYGTTLNYGFTTTFYSLTAAGPGVFEASIGGLAPATLYHFRANADGGINGATAGADMTFTTLTPPLLGTPGATNITTNSATLNGDIVSFGTANVVYVSFEYGLTLAYGNTTASQPMSGPGPFSANIGGLSPGTLYHFREKADGGTSGTSVGPDVTFSTLNIPPGVSTAPATGIATGTAILNGNLASLGTATSVNVLFDYGLTNNYGSRTASQSMAGPGIFSAALSGLNPGSTYHFRTIADGGGQGITTGSDLTFTTLTPAVVLTMSATPVTQTSAILNANLSSLGSSGQVGAFFEYGTDLNYGYQTTREDVAVPGIISYNLTGLDPGTTYHFRAKVDGGASGIVVGGDVSFDTLVMPLQVETRQAAGVTYNSVVLNGYLRSRGEAPTVGVFFEYGPDAGYGRTTQQQELSVTGAFSFNLTGLEQLTTYHFRAVANVGTEGTSLGEDALFTTPIMPLLVETRSASAITFGSTFLNGELTSLGGEETAGVYFDYGETSDYGHSIKVQDMTAKGTFTFNLTGLDPTTTYHFRSRAEAGIDKTAYGADLSFTTLETPPGVTTGVATRITPSAATLNADLTFLPFDTVDVYFEYGRTASYTHTTALLGMSGTGPFSANVTRLFSSTAYHFRAVVLTPSQNKVYGSDVVFVTRSGQNGGGGSGGGGGGGGGSSQQSITILPGQAAWISNTFGLTPGQIVFTSADGKCTVTIGNGTSVLDASGFRVSSAYCRPPVAPAPAPENKVILAVYDLGASGTTFNPAAGVLIRYEKAALPSGIDEASLSLAYYDEKAGVWKPLDNIVVDSSNTNVSGKTSHFTQYALLAPVAVVPTPTPSATPAQTPAPSATPSAVTSATPAPSITPSVTPSRTPQSTPSATAPVKTTPPVRTITPTATAKPKAGGIPSWIIIIAAAVIILAALALVVLRRLRPGKKTGETASFSTAYNNGNSYYRQKKYDAAVNEYSKAIELDSSKVIAYSNRGAAYSAMGDYPKALADHSKAVALDPSYALGYYNRAMVYKGMDRREEAMADLQRVITLQNNASLVLAATKALENLRHQKQGK
jgi:hypothetical protein